MNVSRLLRMVALSGLMVVGSAAMVRAELPAGRLQTAVKELEVIAKKTLKDTGVPGIAIAIVHDDKVIYAKGFGIREAGKDQPIDADTVFQIASMSKPLSSTVLARLVGEGRITWDDRVIDHDPGFRMYDPYVTRELRLRDLLCHRSGLPDHAGDFLEDLGFDKDQVLYRLRYQPPDSSFRSHYAYNNFGYSEVGYAAAKAAGMDWPALAAKNLFEPLGIDRADTAAVRSVQLAVRLAAGEAGIWAYDSAFASVKDTQGFKAEAEAARRLGYLGKTCIHPTQVALANAAFQPSEAEIAWAQRVVAATEHATRAGVGAFLVDGRMVDAPFARRAEAVMALAQKLGLLAATESGSGT